LFFHNILTINGHGYIMYTYTEKRDKKMNERIRELMKQATEEELDYTESGVPCVVREFVPEKFAELVVKECMRMCEVAQVGYLTHGLEKEASGAYSVKQYIEEYLGVEE